MVRVLEFLALLPDRFWKSEITACPRAPKMSVTGARGQAWKCRFLYTEDADAFFECTHTRAPKGAIIVIGNVTHALTALNYM